MRYILLLLASFLFVGCQNGTETQSVTVYVSEDQVFSEPLLRDFQKDTGIKVNAIYDTEESKSTGVMNRLIAEKNNPQADLYWANEPIRAEVLRQKGILTPYKSPNAQGIPKQFVQKEFYWTGFSARVRLIVAQEGSREKPSSILDYINPQFRAKGVIANPLFGTTTAHISALFTIWGEEKTKAFLAKLKANKVAISTSNGESADFVASKRYEFALVDSDDAVSRQKEGKKISFIYPDQSADGLGVFVVPNVVMLLKNAPHTQQAKQLIDYLLSRESEAKLAKADCAQIPLHQGVLAPKALKPLKDMRVMSVDFEKVAQKMLEIQPYLKSWFDSYE